MLTRNFRLKALLLVLLLSIVSIANAQHQSPNVVFQDQSPNGSYAMASGFDGGSLGGDYTSGCDSCGASNACGCDLRPHGHQFSRSGTQYTFGALARAYYYNDQRIQWTGQEETFGAEGVLDGSIMRSFNDWNVSMHGEFFINQPYDRNILVDTPERVSHRGDFEYESFEVSRLYLQASRGDFSVSFGKRGSPFGRFYYPLHTNRQFDAPFIRTESINLRETGVQVEYTPGIWDITLAVVNGSDDLDTNSMKAGIARIGINQDWYAVGASVKWHDGVGSEDQKYRKNHVGLDAMIRHGRWSLSGEVIYDEYGFRRTFDPLAITWGRSIYNRDQYFAGGLLTGVGYYVNLNYQGDVWSTTLNYGSFTPDLFTGDNIHDQITNRAVGKVTRHFGQGLDGITTVIVENDVENAQAGRKRQGFMFYSGLEYRF